MNEQTDSQLLRHYAESHSEAAFSELVRRHLDFVYSAAMRMVCDSHLAEDVTQGVFMALAKSAAPLSERPVLSSWLHRTAQNIAAQTVRTIERRRAREQEAAAMNQLLATEPDATWELVAPHLDAALGELSEPDRDAVMLRYFERKSAREMAQILGTSEVAAQKRVSRAVECLRGFFAKRGVTVGASGLVAALSANAIQAAPVGLAVTISTAAALSGTTIATTATATAVKTIAMTTVQKTIIGATLAAAVGTGVYEARQSALLREQNQALQQQQAPLTEELTQLRGERDETLNKLTAMRQENERLRQQPSEVLKLRAEVSRLRAETQKLAQTKVVTSAEAAGNDPFIQSVLSLAARAIELGQLVDQNPSKRIPEFQLLTENDWLEAAKKSSADSESDPQKILNELRFMAKQKFLHASQPALRSYIEAHQGQLPSDISELKPYFKPPLDDVILQRYQMANTGDASRFDWVRNGKVPRFDDSAWIITEKGPPADKDDDLFKIGLGTSAGGKK